MRGRDDGEMQRKEGIKMEKGSIRIRIEWREGEEREKSRKRG